jgi:hypothetical protein
VFVFHIWLTALLPIKENKIISGLVNKGYSVSPAAATNELTLLADTNAPYGIMACRVHRELASARELYDDVYHILTTSNFTYYSLVISEFSAASFWNAGNAVNDKLLSFTDNKPSKKIVN